MQWKEGRVCHVSDGWLNLYQHIHPCMQRVGKWAIIILLSLQLWEDAVANWVWCYDNKVSKIGSFWAWPDFQLWFVSNQNRVYREEGGYWEHHEVAIGTGWEIYCLLWQQSQRNYGVSWLDVQSLYSQLISRVCVCVWVWRVSLSWEEEGCKCSYQESKSVVSSFCWVSNSDRMGLLIPRIENSFCWVSNCDCPFWPDIQVVIVSREVVMYNNVSRSCFAESAIMGGLGWYHRYYDSEVMT